MSADHHIVYAVTDCCAAPVRVSRPMAWGAAVDRWYALDNHRLGKGPTATSERRTGRAAHPTRYYAVRSADDPAWPRSARAAVPRSAKTGRFI